MPTKRTNPLAAVARRAIKDEAFLKKLINNPKQAVDEAGIQLSAPDLQRLNRVLKGQVVVDVPWIIRRIRTGKVDPWPTGWVS